MDKPETIDDLFEGFKRFTLNGGHAYNEEHLEGIKAIFLGGAIAALSLVKHREEGQNADVLMTKLASEIQSMVPKNQGAPH